MAKAIIVLSVLLVLAAGWIAFRETTLHQSVSDESFNELQAEMTLRHEYEKNEQLAEQADEAYAIQAELLEELDAKSQELEDTRTELDKTKRKKLKQLEKSDTKLKKEIVKQTGAKAEEITIVAENVTMPKVAVINLFDQIYTLKAEVKLCNLNCAMQLAEQKLDLTMPWLAENQQLKQDKLGFQQQNEMLNSRVHFLDRKLKVANGDMVKWLIITGVACLALGFGSGVATDHFGF